MRILYIDNYRGFRNTFLELKQVNFLLGDNSTGKTSILSLINLFSKSTFPIERDFNTQDFELGLFNDIVDLNYKKDFTIGYIRTHFKTSGNRRLSMLLMRFKQGKKGEIELKDYRIIIHKEAYQFKICPDKKIRFVRYQLLNKIPKESDLAAFFQNQVREFYHSRAPRKIDNTQFIVAANGFVRYILDKERHIQNATSLLPRPLYDLSQWIPPIRTSPKRFYELITSSEKTDETPYLLNDLYQAAMKDANKKQILKEIETFSSQANLFKSIKLKSFDKKGRGPFTIELEIAPETRRNLFYLGYGVSQSLPVITNIVLRGSTQIYLIQQPEVHLHPKAQAMIGDLLFQKAVNNKKNFIVETHSDYMVDRFRFAMHNSVNKIFSQVIFFQRENGQNKLYTIEIQPDGKYSDTQPKDFREFFINESIKLLEL